MKHISITKCRLAEDEDPYRRTSLEIESFALIVVSQREGGREWAEHGNAADSDSNSC